MPLSARLPLSPTLPLSMTEITGLHFDEFEIPWTTLAIADEIVEERERQNEKWGEQNHRDGTSAALVDAADWARRIADTAASLGDLTWRDILAEEYYEALSEEDPVRLRAELIQVAAVATAWVEAIDRRC